MNSEYNEGSDTIVSLLEPPKGWELVSDIEHKNVRSEMEDLNTLKSMVDRNLPSIAERVEFFVESIHGNSDIVISQTYMSLDPDAFHLIFLVSAKDFFSPRLQYVKMKASSYFGAYDDADIRTTFMIDTEYMRAHVSSRIYRLKYRYLVAA